MRNPATLMSQVLHYKTYRTTYMYLLYIHTVGITVTGSLKKQILRHE